MHTRATRLASAALGGAAIAGLLATALSSPARAAAEPLKTIEVRPAGEPGIYVADAVVEAVRQSVLSAQVSGEITALPVRAGERVRPGQVLARIDPRVAADESAARQASVAAAQADADAARRELERVRRLRDRQYLSQAAFEQADARAQAADAAVRAAEAQAGAARTLESLHVVAAPFAGLLSSVDVERGEIAAPGRPLMTLYDPSALRVTATLPESAARGIEAGKPVRVEIPALHGAPVEVPASAVSLLPGADPATHTMQLRIALPSALAQAGPPPGTFARALLPSAVAKAARIALPASALVRRIEMNGVYVVDSAGRTTLRQVRLGRATGDSVEILAGLEPGERVAAEPLAAAAQAAAPGAR